MPRHLRSRTAGRKRIFIPASFARQVKPRFGVTPTRATGRRDCTEAEIQTDILRAKTGELGAQGFVCTEARRRFLAERGQRLLTREELITTERRVIAANRRRERDITFAQRIRNTLGGLFGGREMGEAARGVGFAAVGLVALGIFILVIARR